MTRKEPMQTQRQGKGGWTDGLFDARGPSAQRPTVADMVRREAMLAREIMAEAAELGDALMEVWE